MVGLVEPAIVCNGLWVRKDNVQARIVRTLSTMQGQRASSGAEMRVEQEDKYAAMERQVRA